MQTLIVHLAMLLALAYLVIDSLRERRLRARAGSSACSGCPLASLACSRCPSSPQSSKH